MQSLIDKVDERTPGHPKYKGKPSKNFKKPRNWRIAKAIYRWIAKNVKYDWESLKKDKNGNSLRKPQDALFAFATRQCLCTGYADLVKVMMRLAGIPCAAVETVRNSENPKMGHIYNAVYLDNPNDNKKGWALLDGTEGSPEEESYKKTPEHQARIKKWFPAFYEDLSIEDANRSMIVKKDHKIRLIFCEFRGDNLKSAVLFNYNDTVAYYLAGSEKNAYIDILKNHSRLAPLRNVQIPDDMLKLGLKFKIKLGIESLILKGDEEISDDFSRATDLKSIDTTHSNNYDGYDAANKKLVYKKEYIDRLTKKLKDKINNEYNKMYIEHREFIKSIGIEFNSQQDSTTEARKEAFDFVDNIFQKKIELTCENFDKANDLMNKAIENMKQFKHDTLWRLWNDKIQKDKCNEYNKIHDEHREFIKSIGIEFNSQQDSTTEARKEAFDFVDNICQKKIELTYENFNKANDLMNKAIENMKQFKKDTLVTILNKKRKQFEKRVVKHRIFRNSLNGNFIDFTLKYRQNAVNFYNSIYNSITEANVKQAVGLFDVAIKQMDQFKFKYMNNNFMNNNFMNNNHFNNNFMNNFNNNFMNNNFMNNNFMNNNHFNNNFMNNFNNNFMNNNFNNNNNFMNLGMM